MRRSLFVLGLVLAPWFGSCAMVPPQLHKLSLGSAVLEWGALQQQGHQGRLASVRLRVPMGAEPLRCWSFEFLLFDDRDGDGQPQPAEFLARRQALGARPSVVHFPRLRFAGTPVRPHLQLRFREGRAESATTLALTRPLGSD